jgi:hypothetical protein
MDHHLQETLPDGWSVASHCPDPQSIGFATTPTPAIIRQAIGRKIAAQLAIDKIVGFDELYF